MKDYDGRELCFEVGDIVTINADDVEESDSYDGFESNLTIWVGAITHVSIDGYGVMWLDSLDDGCAFADTPLKLYVPAAIVEKALWVSQ